MSHQAETALFISTVWGSLPDFLLNIDTFTKLDTLHVLGVECTTAVPMFTRLSSLTTLQMNGTGIQDLPSDLGGLTSLRHLCLNTNPMFGDIASLNSLKLLTQLRLVRCEFVKMPPAILELHMLDTLDLSINHLQTLPPEFTQLTSLTCLGLGGNALTALPDTVGHLTALTELYVGENHLSMLPDTFGMLRLGALALHANRFDVLPACLTAVTSLVTLSIEENPFVFPTTIGRLTNLEQLHITGSQLGDCRRQLSTLVNLSNLSVRSLRSVIILPLRATLRCRRATHYALDQLCATIRTTLALWVVRDVYELVIQYIENEPVEF